MYKRSYTISNAYKILPDDNFLAYNVVFVIIVVNVNLMWLSCYRPRCSWRCSLGKTFTIITWKPISIIKCATNRYNCTLNNSAWQHGMVWLVMPIFLCFPYALIYCFCCCATYFYWNALFHNFVFCLSHIFFFLCFLLKINSAFKSVWLCECLP